MMFVSRRERLRNTLHGERVQETECPQPPLEAFEEKLDRWAMQCCVFRDRSFGGVKALHRDYFAWCIDHAMDLPCSPRQFTEWLIDQGFQLRENGLVYGLVLKSDLMDQPGLYAERAERADEAD
jgi:hypothetical protein